jgi:hypothetical protein
VTVTQTRGLDTSVFSLRSAVKKKAPSTRWLKRLVIRSRSGVQAKADASSVVPQYHHPADVHTGAVWRATNVRANDCGIRAVTITNPGDSCQYDRPFLLDQQALLPYLG